MTIKEIERATGMSRANIRFYESEGLITPRRHDNGYREYSTEHTEILLRIKLLRCLQMSLDDIKKLQAGQEDLLTALDRQIGILTEKQAQLENSSRICREMKDDGVTYSTLDAQKYLRSMDTPVKTQTVLTRDVTPRLFIPWRRFFARMLDELICGMAVMAILFHLRDGVQPGNFLINLLALGLTLLLEPLQLTLFGTTLGKWIFGIRISDSNGRKLSFGEGLYRTWQVKLHGQFFGIPILTYWRMWKSYKTYNDGYELPWEEDSEITCTDESTWRYGVAAAVAAAAFGLAVVVSVFSGLPNYRGDLTVEQFCANYRQVMKQQDKSFEPYYLADDGTWEKEEQYGTVYVYIGGSDGRPLDFRFTTENGIITSITLTEEFSGNSEDILGNNNTQIGLAVLSFLRAQPGYNIFTDDAADIARSIIENPFGDVSTEICSVRINCDYAFTGYATSGSLGLLFPIEDSETYSYSMTFTMELTQ